ncbi:hypothetical protein CC1G_13923 [Coprinopsis cinerea okayama7|uniref:Uncharacterized protein n=1 Tax=Coprinopsis cinerea (strain Okayama-7 / 130 / ATCC MYA-4618 / FGSC 9003) TaxID=240176 RepID=D6RKH3_COPC7|nr:hypothetical protein CC1G_13923 [Coprinopsis cinerea okayama7\|eukprot:XP_002911883.1 hypothetical protein CC1G_13923 [Coprinopsis cinerea okayama7\
MKSFFTRRTDSQPRPSKPSSSRDSYKFWVPQPRNDSEDERPKAVVDRLDQPPVNVRKHNDKHASKTTRKQLVGLDENTRILPPPPPGTAHSHNSHRGLDRAVEPFLRHMHAQVGSVAPSNTYPRSSQRPQYHGTEDTAPIPSSRPDNVRAPSRAASHSATQIMDVQRGYYMDYATKHTDKSAARVKLKESSYLRSKNYDETQHRSGSTAKSEDERREKERDTRGWLRFRRDRDKSRAREREREGDRERERKERERERALDSDREKEIRERERGKELPRSRNEGEAREPRTRHGDQEHNLNNGDTDRDRYRRDRDREAREAERQESERRKLEQEFLDRRKLEKEYRRQEKERLRRESERRNEGEESARRQREKEDYERRKESELEEKRKREEAERRRREDEERRRREKEELELQWKRDKEEAERKWRDEQDRRRQQKDEERRQKELEDQRRAKEERDRKEREEAERRWREEQRRLQEKEELERKQKEEHEFRRKWEEYERQKREEKEQQEREEAARRLFEKEEYERKEREEYARRQAELNRNNRRLKEDERRLKEQQERKQRQEQERRQREELERRQREELERRQREEQERRQREEQERRQREEQERRQREEQERRHREEQERRQREEQERRQREEQERRQREEQERRQREEQERRQREEQERRQREEQERRQREEQERKQREERERYLREEAERKQKEREEIERRYREELERAQREESARREQEERERKEKEEVERRQREEQERRRKEELERKEKEELDRRQKEEAEKKSREEHERRRREEEERKQREEAEKRQREERERRLREEMEKKQREELERKQREEAEKRQREEQERRQKEETERRQKEEYDRRQREEAEKRQKELERSQREESEREEREAERRQREEYARRQREEAERRWIEEEQKREREERDRKLEDERRRQEAERTRRELERLKEGEERKKVEVEVDVRKEKQLEQERKQKELQQEWERRRREATQRRYEQEYTMKLQQEKDRQHRPQHRPPELHGHRSQSHPPQPSERNGQPGEQPAWEPQGHIQNVDRGPQVHHEHASQRKRQYDTEQGTGHQNQAEAVEEKDEEDNERARRARDAEARRKKRREKLAQLERIKKELEKSQRELLGRVDKDTEIHERPPKEARPERFETVGEDTRSSPRREDNRDDIATGGQLSPDPLPVTSQALEVAHPKVPTNNARLPLPLQLGGHTSHLKHGNAVQSLQAPPSVVVRSASNAVHGHVPKPTGATDNMVLQQLSGALQAEQTNHLQSSDGVPPYPNVPLEQPTLSNGQVNGASFFSNEVPGSQYRTHRQMTKGSPSSNHRKSIQVDGESGHALRTSSIQNPPSQSLLQQSAANQIRVAAIVDQGILQSSRNTSTVDLPLRTGPYAIATHNGSGELQGSISRHQVRSSALGVCNDNSSRESLEPRRRRLSNVIGVTSHSGPLRSSPRNQLGSVGAADVLPRTESDLKLSANSHPKAPSALNPHSANPVNSTAHCPAIDALDPQYGTEMTQGSASTAHANVLGGQRPNLESWNTRTVVHQAETSTEASNWNRLPSHGLETKEDPTPGASSSQQGLFLSSNSPTPINPVESTRIDNRTYVGLSVPRPATAQGYRAQSMNPMSMRPPLSMRTVSRHFTDAGEPPSHGGYDLRVLATPLVKNGQLPDLSLNSKEVGTTEGIENIPPKMHSMGANPSHNAKSAARGGTMNASSESLPKETATSSSKEAKSTFRRIQDMEINRHHRQHGGAIAIHDQQLAQGPPSNLDNLDTLAGNPTLNETHLERGSFKHALPIQYRTRDSAAASDEERKNRQKSFGEKKDLIPSQGQGSQRHATASASQYQEQPGSSNRSLPAPPPSVRPPLMQLPSMIEPSSAPPSSAHPHHVQGPPVRSLSTMVPPPSIRTSPMQLPSVDQPSTGPPPSVRPPLMRLPPPSHPSIPPPSVRPPPMELPSVDQPSMTPPPSTRPPLAQLPVTSHPVLSHLSTNHLASVQSLVGGQIPVTRHPSMQLTPSIPLPAETGNDRGHGAIDTAHKNTEPQPSLRPVHASARPSVVPLPTAASVPFTRRDDKAKRIAEEVGSTTLPVRYSSHLYDARQASSMIPVPGSTRPHLVDLPSSANEPQSRQHPYDLKTMKHGRSDYRFPTNTTVPGSVRPPFVPLPSRDDENPTRRPASHYQSDVPTSAPPTVQRHAIPRNPQEADSSGRTAPPNQLSSQSSRHKHSSSFPATIPHPPASIDPRSSGQPHRSGHTIVPGTTRQAPIPLPARSYETIHQTGNEGDETILMTPSSLAPMMLASNSQQSFTRSIVPLRDSPPEFVNELVSSGFKAERQPSTAPSRHPEPQIDPKPSKVIDDREHPPKPSKRRHRPKVETEERHGSRAVPIHGSTEDLQQQKPVFTPFRYLERARKQQLKRTMSQASLEARDGNGAPSTVVGSPSVSICSTAPFQLPPTQDPLAAAEEWRNKEEAKFQESKKNRRPRPGVVIGVAEDPGEDSKPSRRPKRTRDRRRPTSNRPETSAR